MQAATPEAYQLLHEGVRALSKVEANGIRVDVAYLTNTIKDVKAQIRELESEMRSSEVGKAWRREFGQRTKYSSGKQLARVLFEVMGYDPPERTRSGQYKTDIATIERVDDPFVADYLKASKLKHTLNTFLRGIQREVTSEGFAHVNFNLHTVVTFRSSSSAFNFQNLPIRDPEQGEIIRRCFIARDGCRIVERDFSGIEVGISACYNKDPRLISYIKDPTKDMHRDMAAECFCCKTSQVSKAMRQIAKGSFVFPQFYGSFWRDCAAALWDDAHHHQLQLENGRTVVESLARQGITELGECLDGEGKLSPESGYYKHISKVESDFWNKKFRVYRDWKRSWYKQYLKQGWFKTKTGFVISGSFSRNDVINYPVQGSAFHCLLWALIRIQKILKKRGMKSLIIGQIHDSIVADVPDEELDDYLEISERVMTVDLPKHWPWIIVPLEAEVEVTPVNGSWHEKKLYKAA